MAEERILPQSHKGSDAKWVVRSGRSPDRQSRVRDWLLRDYDRCLLQHIHCASNHVPRASSYVRKNVAGAVAPARSRSVATFAKTSLVGNAARSRSHVRENVLTERSHRSCRGNSGLRGGRERLVRSLCELCDFVRESFMAASVGRWIA